MAKDKIYTALVREALRKFSISKRFSRQPGDQGDALEVGRNTTDTNIAVVDITKEGAIVRDFNTYQQPTSTISWSDPDFDIKLRRLVSKIVDVEKV